VQRHERHGSKLEISGTKHSLPLPIRCGQTKTIRTRKKLVKNSTLRNQEKEERKKSLRGGSVFTIIQTISMLKYSKKGICFFLYEHLNISYRPTLEEKCLMKDTKTVYWLDNTLYLNITNQCSNCGYFCLKRYSRGVGGFNLKLTEEPSVAQIMAELTEVLHIRSWDELVFAVLASQRSG